MFLPLKGWPWVVRPALRRRGCPCGQQASGRPDTTNPQNVGKNVGKNNPEIGKLNRSGFAGGSNS